MLVFCVDDCGQEAPECRNIPQLPHSFPTFIFWHQWLWHYYLFDN